MSRHSFTPVEDGALVTVNCHPHLGSRSNVQGGRTTNPGNCKCNSSKFRQSDVFYLHTLLMASPTSAPLLAEILKGLATRPGPREVELLTSVWQASEKVYIGGLYLELVPSNVETLILNVPSLNQPFQKSYLAPHVRYGPILIQSTCS